MLRSRSLGTALALALLVAGCGDGGGDKGPGNAAAPAIRATNTYSDGLKNLSELYRYLGLRRAIVDNGRRCKKVILGAYQEEYKSMALWTARCTDTGDWSIFLAPNGQVQVSPCADAATLHLPICRLPKDQGSAEAPATKG
ncbi:MAG: hypothetical protein E6G94_07735 [Alphaproteobacteria bacterium]|nr:MAG: hypothetical protein E6G94_07735 [Alphaproteobacteria bacterium]